MPNLDLIGVEFNFSPDDQKVCGFWEWFQKAYFHQRVWDHAFACCCPDDIVMFSHKTLQNWSELSLFSNIDRNGVVRKAIVAITLFKVLLIIPDGGCLPIELNSPILSHPRWKDLYFAFSKIQSIMPSFICLVIYTKRGSWNFQAKLQIWNGSDN